jgi:hypothetical protein
VKSSGRTAVTVALLQNGDSRPTDHKAAFTCVPEVSNQALSLFFIYQDLPGLPMALRVSGRLTVLPTS